MASEAVATGSSSEGLTPAQQLMQQHDHHATVEDVVDEEDIVHPPPSATLQSDTADGAAAPLSEKAAGKQKAADSAGSAKKAGNAPLNTASEEAFPALGPVKPRVQAPVAPAWGKKPASLATNGANGSGPTSRASTPASGITTPVSLPSRGLAQPSMALPGKHKETINFYTSDLKPVRELKKPIPQLIHDINKRSKAQLARRETPNGVAFEATGPPKDVRQALVDIANEVLAKQTVKLSIPASVRPFIIGRGGDKIKDISNRSGARVQIPKQDVQDEDDEVDVIIEGNALTAGIARQEIMQIVKERTSTVNLRLKDIPAEYYPFLAGPRNSLIENLQGDRDVRVQIPHYHTWDERAPAQDPKAFVPQAKYPIQISGDREAAQEIQAEIQRRVDQLRKNMAVNQQNIERGRHQFIAGDRGYSLHDFLEETGCTIIVPPGSDPSEDIYVVGPPDKIQAGVEKLQEIAFSMQSTHADAARAHTGPNAQAHARNMSRYLRQRQLVNELERLYNTSIVAPTERDGPTAWEIFGKEARDTQKARSDIMSVFASHPPSRFSTVNVDPFYHQHLQQRNAQHVRDNMGVHIVFPEEMEESPELILVYEGPTPHTHYAIPRGAPAPAEAQDYQKGLREAQQFIQNLTRNQQELASRDIEADSKFHPKIQRFVEKEQQGLGQDQFPVQLLFGDRRPQARRSNNSFGMRGPANSLEDLYAKVLAFIEQEEKDELERGYTTSFDFPQKYANFLIGKGGENIRKLREEFDVDIQVNDGKVELKGPQAKANACKAHIESLARRLADEATHTLKIKPQYHRDLIGAKGSTVNRLQDRYNVRINFPRSNGRNDDEVGDGASQRNFRAQAPDEVIVRGPRKGADEARDELLSLLQYAVDNSHTDSVFVAQSQVPQLIGSGGREMENLRYTTGCQIDVPGAREAADPSGRAEIKLKGSKKQVEEAKKLLQERAKVFDDTVVRTINVDRKHHRSLIGGGGSNIRSIVTAAGGPDNSRELARMVRFPRAETDESVIRVEGPKSVVEKIIASLEAQVATLENQVTETVEISPDKHRLLIGRGGETRRSLEEKFAIQLDIPKQTTTGAARSQVKISGAPAQVQQAKEHILDLVKGQEGETIQVPLHLHHLISDNGQFFRRLRNEHKVTVDHAGHQVPPRPTQEQGGKARKGANGALPLITDDTTSGAEAHSWELVENNHAEGDTSATIPWVLRGPADNLPKARQTLEKTIEAASKPSATGYLILPDPRSYRLVVGPGGSTINSIRKKTGTKVQVPRDQAQDEAIEIVGPKEGCEQARDMILDIVSRGGNGGRK